MYRGLRPGRHLPGCLQPAGVHRCWWWWPGGPPNQPLLCAGLLRTYLPAARAVTHWRIAALKETLGTIAIATGGLSSGLVLAATGGNYTLTMAASAVPPALALAWYAAVRGWRCLAVCACVQVQVQASTHQPDAAFFGS